MIWERRIISFNSVCLGNQPLFLNFDNCIFQIGLVDMLHAMGIKPDGMIGHSVGELGCAYADGCLTAEQAIRVALERGKASRDAVLIRGMMAAVGKLFYDIIQCVFMSIDLERYVQDVERWYLHIMMYISHKLVPSLFG